MLLNVLVSGVFVQAKALPGMNWNNCLFIEAMKNKLPNDGKNAPNQKGEAMKDSMMESTVNNDNKKLPSAEDFTNKDGELDAEAFKKSYQEDATIIKEDHTRN